MLLASGHKNYQVKRACMLSYNTCLHCMLIAVKYITTNTASINVVVSVTNSSGKKQQQK